MGSAPGAISVGAGAIWAVDLDDQTVFRVDPGSLEVTTFARATPTDLATGADAVWVASGEPVTGTQSAGPVATAIARVDPTTRTVRARVRLPRSGGAAAELTDDHVAVERDAVWAIAPDYAVVRIDPRTNRIVATIRGLQARACVAAGHAGVWVLGIDGTIARIDRRTNRIAARGRIGIDSRLGRRRRRRRLGQRPGRRRGLANRPGSPPRHAHDRRRRRCRRSLLRSGIAVGGQPASRHGRARRARRQPRDARSETLGRAARGVGRRRGRVGLGYGGPGARLRRCKRRRARARLVRADLLPR